MNKEKTAVIVTAALILGSLMASAVRWWQDNRPQPELIPHFNVVLDLASSQDTTRALVTGYHHNLIKRFADAHDRTVAIRLKDYGESPADSLMAGSCDLLVTTLDKVPERDSLLLSHHIDGNYIWIMNEERKHEMKAAVSWLKDHIGSAADSTDREKFFHPYGFHHGTGKDFLSPYDELLKAEADSLGWDWRMLAAIVYHESGFHIEAVSVRGARGLSQLLPSTARHFGGTDLLDPEDNIRTGARCLRNYAFRYRNIGDNRSEWFKYTLASFNAGPGRIDDCINYALFRGRNPSYWINVAAVIPEMADESVMNSGAVRLGTFKGTETLMYVDRIFNTYLNMCSVCPE